MMYVACFYSADSSDIYLYIVQLSFSFIENSSSEKVAPSFSIFWDISAQSYCGVVELSNVLAIERYIIVSYSLILIVEIFLKEF